MKKHQFNPTKNIDQLKSWENFNEWDDRLHYSLGPFKQYKLDNLNKSPNI